MTRNQQTPDRWAELAKVKPFGFTVMTPDGPKRGVIRARSREDAAARVAGLYNDRETRVDENHC